MNQKYLNSIDKIFYKSIDNLYDKKVIIRSCLNVDIDPSGSILDYTRLEESFPLIKEIVQIARSVVVISHIGRPKHKDPRFSVNNVIKYFNTKLENTNISIKVLYSVDEKSFLEVQNNAETSEKSIFFLENIRFFEEEEHKNIEIQKGFAKKLANFGDIFINDAFADYRISASTYHIAKELPSYIGPVFKKEVENLNKLLNPIRPFTVVMGGSKLSDKIEVLHSLLKVADKVLLGGAMAYTLLLAKNVNVGKSLVEKDKLDVAKEILVKYEDKILLPIDHVVSNSIENITNTKIMDGYIDTELYGIDIGPATIKIYEDEIKKSNTILWNGPVGIFEKPNADVGTKVLASVISLQKNKTIIVGGGETILAINKFVKSTKNFTHISTGGGAMLAYIAYENFPTLDVIMGE